MLTIPDFNRDDPLWTSPAGQRSLEVARELRLARQERIREMYRAVWDPIPVPRGGLPLVPGDHINSMLEWAKLGNPADTHAAVEELRRHSTAPIAAEYAAALLSEAVARATGATSF